VTFEGAFGAELGTLATAESVAAETDFGADAVAEIKTDLPFADVVAEDVVDVVVILEMEDDDAAAKASLGVAAAEESMGDEAAAAAVFALSLDD